VSTKLQIRPMTADQFDTWRQRRRDANITGLQRQGLSAEEAATLDQRDFDKMLPEGLQTPGEHLALFVHDEQVVGFVWVRLRRRSAGVEAFIHDFHLMSGLDPRAREAALRLVEHAFRAEGADWLRFNVEGRSAEGLVAMGYLPTRYRMSRSLASAEPLEYADVPAVRLEPMNDDQFAEYVDLVRQQEAQGRAHAMISPPQEAQQAADELAATMLANRTDDAHRFLVGVGDSGSVVGRLWFKLEERPDGLHSVGYDFSVNEELRGAGYGRAMLAAMRRFHLDHGARSMSFIVYGYNTRAKKLYESIGYEVTQVQLRKKLV
jgi:ribosomal protein S18 acetylase RimI-like enzyme